LDEDLGAAAAPADAVAELVGAGVLSLVECAQRRLRISAPAAAGVAGPCV
jgi:hypothetical protein